uniref:Interleukin 23 receptor n=1 Tax=Varanus komodoensis TaxID=61221 RepID=A0A8D2IMI8_VARKO
CNLFSLQWLLYLSQTARPILCYGHVWTEPANINQIGQDISINCHSDKEFCENAKIYMDLNEVRVEDSNLTVINKTTVQLQLHNYGEPFSKVVCNVQCSKTRVVICGTQFCMGYLPDRPANLACVIQEYSDCMICTWDPGKDTYLNTSYNLYLKSVQTKENKTFNANSALNGVNIPLNQLQKNQTFSVSVCAKNALGAAHSDQLLVELHNIVIPALPVITQNKTIDSPIRKTIMQWEEQSASNETSCEERYKEMASEKWHVREWDASIQRMHRTEYNLNANTMYEFQVRCKFTHVGSIWSKWSESVVYKTPEKLNGEVLPPLFFIYCIKTPVLESSTCFIIVSQGKNSSAAHDAAPLFADYADAVVTEVEEIMVHKQHKTLDDEKETREDISLKVNFPEDTAVGNSDMPEENGYKPQVFNKTFQGSVFNGGLDIHSQNPGVKSTLPMNSFVRDYTNPMIALCPVAGTDENMFLVEKISLVLNNSRNEQNNMVSSAVEESDTPMANQWKSLLSGEDIQEQTLIPDEMLSGLKAVNYGGSPNVMGYFTQNTHWMHIIL